MPKKIIYIVSTLQNAGPTSQLLNIIKYMNREEFEAVVITLSEEGGQSSISNFLESGIEVLPLKVNRFNLFKTYSKVSRAIDELKPDLIHSQGLRGDFFVSLFCRSVKCICTIRSFPQIDYVAAYGKVIGGIMWRLHLHMMQRFDKCVAVSRSVGDNLSQLARLDNKYVIENGIDTSIYNIPNDFKKLEWRQKSGIKQDAKVFVTAGPLIERKDPLFLIEIWKKLYGSEESQVLMFLGDGPLIHECKKSARSYKNIVFLGSVPNVAPYLHLSNCYVSASTGEGMPNAVLEALAAGLPAALSGIEPHYEVHHAFPKVTSTFVLGDMSSFEQSINKIREVSGEDISLIAERVFKQRFSAKIMSKNYQHLYKKVIDGS